MRKYYYYSVYLCILIMVHTIIILNEIAPYSGKWFPFSSLSLAFSLSLSCARSLARLIFKHLDFLHTRRCADLCKAYVCACIFHTCVFASLRSVPKVKAGALILNTHAHACATYASILAERACTKSTSGGMVHVAAS